MPDSTHSSGHCAVDLGEEEFTVGRPHPMIDNDLRIRRLLQEAQDPETGVIMLDVVLGYGAHPDPAAELGGGGPPGAGAAPPGGRSAGLRRLGHRHGRRPAGPEPPDRRPRSRRGGRLPEQRRRRQACRRDFKVIAVAEILLFRTQWIAESI